MLYDFNIVTSNTDIGMREPFQVTANKWEKHSQYNVIYLSRRNQKSKIFKKLILETGCEIIYFNSLFDYTFTIKPLIALKSMTRKKIIVAPRGELNKNALSIKKIKKHMFLRLSRYTNIFNDATFQATSLQEEEDIKRVFNNKIVLAENLKFIPEGVSQSDFHSSKKENSLRIAFLSRVSAMKNLIFAFDVLSETHYEIVFDIFGVINSKKSDQIYWSECTRKMKDLPNNIQARYVREYNSDEVFDILKVYDLFFLPTLGENFGHVILESLIAGTPVLISDRTPFRSLQKIGIGWDLSLDNKSDFINVLRRCYIMGEDEYSIIRKKCKLYAINYLEKQQGIVKYSELFS